MANSRHHRFTIYDMMEVKGVFEDNHANQSSPGYKGPLAYPRMFYHPEGQTRVLVPAEILQTPMGPKLGAEQREIVNRFANSLEEEKKLREEGWHDHPAKAIAAGGGEAPAISSDMRITELEAEIARLTAEREQARSMAVTRRPAAVSVETPIPTR